MDVTIKKSKEVEIQVAHDEPMIDVGNPRSIEIGVNPATLEIKPKKVKGLTFDFFERIIAGANVVRCTLAEFEAIQHYDGKTWYAVTTTTDELRYLYLGPTLIAQADQSGGTWGFAYTFPIIFGR